MLSIEISILLPSLIPQLGLERLYKELDSHDIKAWVDLNELHQYVGEEYTNRIHRGIDNSEFYLLIYTKDIEESDFIIKEELSYAVNNHKTILFYPKEEIDINKSKLKNPDTTYYQVVMKLSDKLGLPDKFIIGLSIVCKDFAYSCSEFPTFGLKGQDIIKEIRGILSSYLPF